jgi:hypothetical protein
VHAPRLLACGEERRAQPGDLTVDFEYGAAHELLPASEPEDFKRLGEALGRLVGEQLDHCPDVLSVVSEESSVEEFSDVVPEELSLISFAAMSASESEMRRSVPTS